MTFKQEINNVRTTSLDFESYVSIEVADDVTIGTILEFAGDTPPDDFLLVNGGAIPKGTALANILGNTYGETATHVYLPPQRYTSQYIPTSRVSDTPSSNTWYDIIASTKIPEIAANGDMDNVTHVVMDFSHWALSIVAANVYGVHDTNYTKYHKWRGSSEDYSSDGAVITVPTTGSGGRFSLYTKRPSSFFKHGYLGYYRRVPKRHIIKYQ